MKDALIVVARDLNKDKEVAADRNMTVATVIICCLRKISYTDISLDELLNIFGLFTITFDHEKRECPELFSFLKILSNENLK